MKAIFVVGALLLPTSAVAQTCADQYAALYADIGAKYQISHLRQTTVKIIDAMTTSEKSEITALSKRFNATPHDTPNNQNDRYAMQARARAITRAAAHRAGYKIFNPETGSPYDAVIGQKISTDGYVEYTVEVRSLLVLADPRPHVTLWMGRFDPTHNPKLIVTLSIMAAEENDYASWRPNANAGRITGTMEELIKSLMPAECR